MSKNKDANLHFKLAEQVMERLQAWAGFALVAEAIDRFPLVNIYLAGGVLRNLLSESTTCSKDFDFFITGEGEDLFLQYLAERGHLSYGPFGSPRWHGPQSDSCYCDIISINSFDNGMWKCKDIVDVLNQFDFTANAVAIDLRTNELFNPQNGIRDAQQRIMRAVRFDYPDERISCSTTLTRNSVLWMRLNHYASALGFEVEHVTLEWLRSNLGYISDIANFETMFFKPIIDATALQSLSDHTSAT
jgi:hypothetical protein